MTKKLPILNLLYLPLCLFFVSSAQVNKYTLPSPLISEISVPTIPVEIQKLVMEKNASANELSKARQDYFVKDSVK